MKEQTFIICFQRDGKTIDFERWSYKRLNTCIKNTVQLYRDLYHQYRFVRDNHKNVDKVVAYRTISDGSGNIKVWEVDYDDFVAMINNEKSDCI